MAVLTQFYLERAAAARHDADRACLANERKRWSRAADAWDALAARADRTANASARRAREHA